MTNSKLFFPYIYNPNSDADYIVLVTPLGVLHLNKPKFQEIALSLVLVALSGVLLHYIWRKVFVKDSVSNVIETSFRKTQNKEQKCDLDTGVSALQENIIRNGANSYYYAHRQRQSSNGSDEATVKKTMISTYAWTDQKSFVDIYLSDAISDDFTDDQLKVKWTTSSLSLDLFHSDNELVAKSLIITKLYGSIKDVFWKKKKKNLTLTLVKDIEEEWKSLNAAAHQLEDHIEYDESLYD